VSVLLWPSTECKRLVRFLLLTRARPKLGKLQSDAKDLFDLVGSTCSLAENISSKVRELDLAKVRTQVFLFVCAYHSSPCSAGSTAISYPPRGRHHRPQGEHVAAVWRRELR
jgi:hypothetical protein